MPQNYDMGPTTLLPLRRKACWGYFRPKNPTAWAGIEPANLGTKGQHATPRPPKPNLIHISYLYFIYNIYTTITVILAKHCVKLPDDGSQVIRNMFEQF